jgi:hypothetical protein
MPLNESRRKTRERWPLQFDLEGVPRETAERNRLLEQLKFSIPEDTMASKNKFIVDTTPKTEERDLSKEIRVQHRHQEYPRAVYNHDNGHVAEVADEKQFKTLEKHGYQLKPALDRDYSQIHQRTGCAPLKEASPIPEDVQSAEDELQKLLREEEEAGQD